MSRDRKTGEEFNPAQAFVFAFDHAIAVAVKCLRDEGCDEECIWQALRKSLASITKAVEESDPPKLASVPAKLPVVRQRSASPDRQPILVN
jgi:hypothetical protein